MAIVFGHPCAGSDPEHDQDAAAVKDVFPFLRLPRELRDSV